MRWITFGNRKWTRACVELATDHFVRTRQRLPSRGELETLLRQAYADYSWPL